MYRFPVLQLYIWPVQSSIGFTIWCFPDTIIQVVTVAWQHKLIESSEKYLQYNLNILMEVKDLWLQSDEYYTAPFRKRLPDLSLLTIHNHFWVWCNLYMSKHFFSKQRMRCFHDCHSCDLSHFSFRFPSLFAARNLIWSSLEFIEVLFLW